MQERSDVPFGHASMLLLGEGSEATDPVFEAMASLPRSMASSLLALPRSCHDLGKDAMAMQYRAKANHD